VPADEVYTRVPIRFRRVRRSPELDGWPVGLSPPAQIGCVTTGGRLVPVGWIGVSSGTRWAVACLSS
jgi:hypothetical protein